MNDYISWKIDQKKFYKAVEEDMKLIEKTEKEKNPQKTEVWNITNTLGKDLWKQISEGKKEPIIGETHSVSLSRTDASLMELAQVTITWKDRYALQIANYDPITNLSTGEKNEYVKSFQFLGKMWLGYLVKHIEPLKLYELMTYKRNGETKSGSIDGRFDKDEKLHFLKSLSRTIWLDEKWIITPDMNYEQMSTKFKSTLLTQWWFEKILGNSWFMKDGIIQVGKFEDAIKWRVHST
jgi:hypothetical protein